MSAKYRIRQWHDWFTPQRKLLGVWFNLARPQPTMERARAVVRQHLAKKGITPAPLPPGKPADLPPPRGPRPPGQ